MNNYEEIVGIKTRFENSSEEELTDYLYSFSNKWVLNNNKNITTFINKACENFGLSEDFTYEELNTNYKKCLYNIVYLQQSIINKNNNEEQFEEHQKKFNKSHNYI